MAGLVADRGLAAKDLGGHVSGRGSRGWRRRAGSRTVLPRTAPGRIRAAAAAAVLLAGCLAVLMAAVFSGLGSGFGAIGGQDGPEVDAATGLYFSLNDMDAQVANVLMTSGNPALAATRSRDMATYSRDRAAADADLQDAAVTAAGSVAAQGELRSVLDGLAQYDTLAADARLADQPSSGGTGPATAAAVAYYEQATDLMRTRILPPVAQLTSVSAARLDGAYLNGKATASTGIVAVTVIGVALLAALGALQAYLAVRFRRLLNPALLAATVAALGMVVAAVVQLSSETGHLRVAKQEAFDSLIALTQARAVSYDANADESRYLVDRGRAAQYQQAFLRESQQLAGVGNVGILQYDAALAADVTAYQADNADVRFGGYLGAEFRNITFPGERAAAVRTLLAYQAYQLDDRRLRSLAKSDPAAAIAFDTGTAPGQSDGAFNQYDAALSSLITINARAFTAAVQAGRGGAAEWNGALPAAAAAAIAALTILGVRPRLTEYS